MKIFRGLVVAKKREERLEFVRSVFHKDKKNHQKNHKNKRHTHSIKMKILILCTGNSCRSQMAEGFLKSFDEKLQVYSSGTKPSKQVHKNAILVMQEIGIDISNNKPKLLAPFLEESFDYVITVCGNAKENCPVFLGKVTHKLHIGFEDPDELKGTKEEILTEFKRIRNEILIDFYSFYNHKVRNK